MGQDPIFYEDYLKIWAELNSKESDIEIVEKYEAISKIMGQYAKLNNQFISIFNTKSQKVLYMSDNYLKILDFNCSEEEYKKWSTVYWLRNLPLEQSWFFMQMSIFYKLSVQPKNKKEKINRSLDWYMHNFKLKPQKEQKHISLTCKALEFNKNGTMLVMLLIIKDISPYIKENSPWWAEFKINGNENYSFHENNKNFNACSLLTDREKEVLLLIKNHFSSKEIAEKLFISSQTVDKHRKNMLEKTGARDISSLLQICEIGKLL